MMYNLSTEAVGQQPTPADSAPHADNSSRVVSRVRTGVTYGSRQTFETLREVYRLAVRALQAQSKEVVR